MKCLSAIAVLLLLSAPSFGAGVLGACAHRGDTKEAPENTVPAFHSAVAKGAHMIEFDVCLTKDGQLVLMHDATVDRTTDGSGKVAELGFEEIRALDAGSWFSPDFAGVRVPALTEALAAIPENILCNIHLKGGAEVGEATARVVQRLNRMGHCFLACETEAAAAARASVPEIKICNMDRQGGDGQAYVRGTIETGAQFIQMRGSEEGLAALTAQCAEKGVTVNFFGAEEPEKIRRLAKAGVQYILTDDLDTCLRLLQEEFGVAPVAPVDDEQAVRTLVQQYFYGILYYDEALLRASFHPDAYVSGIGKDGQLDHSRFDAWVVYTRGKAPDPAGRENRIAAVDVSGAAASVKTELRWPSVHYTDYLSLLKSDGQWRIMNKIWKAVAPGN
ncbi:MAG: nuclear transport factor 2 family protein [Candidatus Hydrogenedentes bacterium]|nr:nuclear transport factor 2 family protein [Candidatus Hydrogenedentota bacterium]